MNEQKHDKRNNYDNPIPKPPDEVFDNFLRNVEDRLVTRRFDIDRRRGGKQMSRGSEAR